MAKYLPTDCWNMVKSFLLLDSQFDTDISVWIDKSTPQQMEFAINDATGYQCGIRNTASKPMMMRDFYLYIHSYDYHFKLWNMDDCFEEDGWFGPTVNKNILLQDVLQMFKIHIQM